MDLREQEIREAAARSGTLILDFPQPVRHETRITFQCACGQTFTRMQCDTRRYLKKQPTLRCRTCSYKAFTGLANPRFKPDLPRERRNRRDPQVFVWYREIAKRFNHTCVVSGVFCKDGSAHHLFNYGDYPLFRLDLRNGVWLAKGIHTEFHDAYGRGKNTLQQFQDFYRLKTGRDFPNPFDALPELVQGDPVWLVTEDRVKAYCAEVNIPFIKYRFGPKGCRGNQHFFTTECSVCHNPWEVNWYKHRMLKRDKSVCHKCTRAATVAAKLAIHSA